MTSDRDVQTTVSFIKPSMMDRTGVHPASALCRPNVSCHLVFEHDVNHAVIVGYDMHKLKSAFGAEAIYDPAGALLSGVVETEADALTHQPSIASEKTTPTREARSAPRPSPAHIVACVRRQCAICSE
jgi:hypothetical protein